MDVPLWAWGLTVLGILVMLAVDLFGHVRKPHAPTLREAATWSIAYIAIGLAFGLIVLWGWGSGYAAEYYAGYITEKSLSVDNLFVFVLIMSSFAVPRIYQQKVLFVGIVLALALRTAFIFIGAEIVNNFAWIFYVFGAFLVWTAIMQLRHQGGEEHERKEPLLVRGMRRVVPVTEGFDDDRIWVLRGGRVYITPMLLVMVAIGSADILFAVDSIPAIFGLTQEVFLIFAANAFSLLGLRQLFFLIDGLLDRLVFLNYGLAAILGFIGVKLVIHALHENEVPFINGGEHVEAIPEASIAFSLTFILGVLVVTTVASLLKTRNDHAAGPELPGTGGDAHGGVGSANDGVARLSGGETRQSEGAPAREPSSKGRP